MRNNALQIVLYYDDIEVTNPIGSHRNIHKLGGLMDFMFEYVEHIMYTLQVFSTLCWGIYLQNFDQAIQPYS
jgi:hypothetical protein